jgi:ATP-dependent DNA helicase RecQ
VALGYVRPDHEAFGALRLTEASRPVLKGERRIELRRAQPRKKKPAARPDKPVAAGLVAADAGLLERLKAWRAGQAREQAVPAYVIFHDSTLAALAALRPGDLDGLSAIDGIGAKKLERYGPKLLELLRG